MQSLKTPDIDNTDTDRQTDVAYMNNFNPGSSMKLRFGWLACVCMVRACVCVCVCAGPTDAVVMVEHGGDPIEPEAVKAVLLHPPAKVGQQETQHLPATATKEIQCVDSCIQAASIHVYSLMHQDGCLSDGSLDKCLHAERQTHRNSRSHAVKVE